jgi:hypothetical protein
LLLLLLLLLLTLLLLVLLLLMMLQDLLANMIPGVNQTRYLYQADLVQMFIEAPEYCGYGNVLTSLSTDMVREHRAAIVLMLRGWLLLLLRAQLL